MLGILAVAAVAAHRVKGLRVALARDEGELAIDLQLIVEEVMASLGDAVVKARPIVFAGASRDGIDGVASGLRARIGVGAVWVGTVGMGWMGHGAP